MLCMLLCRVVDAAVLGPRTALALSQSHNGKVVVIESAIRGIAPDTTSAALAAMANAGAVMVRTPPRQAVSSLCTAGRRKDEL